MSEKAMAPHSSTFAWKIPWMEEPGGLQSMGSLRVGHNWATSLSLFTFMRWRRKWQPTSVFLPGESQAGTGEPGGLPSMGFHRVKHDWSALAAASHVTPKIQASSIPSFFFSSPKEKSERYRCQVVNDCPSPERGFSLLSGILLAVSTFRQSLVCDWRSLSVCIYLVA